MSCATFEQTKQLIDLIFGINSVPLEIGNHVLPLETLQGWNILRDFIKTDYNSVFNVERFSNLITLQCDTYTVKEDELQGKIADFLYTLYRFRGDQKGYRFAIHKKDEQSQLRRVVCLAHSIELETKMGKQEIWWRNNSLDLNRYIITIEIRDNFSLRASRKFPVKNDEGQIRCVLSLGQSNRVHTREEAVKFASESLVYAFATQVFHVF